MHSVCPALLSDFKGSKKMTKQVFLSTIVIYKVGCYQTDSIELSKQRQHNPALCNSWQKNFGI